MDISSDESSDDELLLLYLLHEENQKKRRRSIYMDEFNTSRDSRGEFSILCSDLHLSVEKHKSVFRMSKERFDDLLFRVGPLITKKKNHRYPISSEQRLALTLR